MKVTARSINELILRFAIQRENQYNRVLRRQGASVPEYAKKIRAIDHIKVTMSAAKYYNLRGQCRMVILLQHAILEILPRPSSRYKHMRRKISDVLAFCREHLTSQPAVEQHLLKE